jgi:NAD+ synthase
MSEKLSILIAQTNPTVGDIDHNKNIVLEIIDKTHNVDLIIFSELMLTGYPPEDLVLKTAFKDKFMQALEEINEFLKNKNCTVILGMPWDEEGRLYNAAIVLQNGSIVYKHFKNALPNYGVFDEKRIFLHGEDVGLFKLKGVNLGIFICEDIWVQNTVSKLNGTGIDLAISINASPFDVNKMNERLEATVSFSNEIRAPIIYVNQVGGQDEIVFDGNSFLADQNGLIKRLGYCESINEQIDFNPDDKSFSFKEDGKESLDNNDLMYSNLILGLKDYVNKNKFPGVVLGISGGIDSAFSACVATDALGPERVKGILMPSKFTSNESNEDANELGNNLGIGLERISIEEIIKAYDSTLDPLFKESKQDITEENIQSRTRGSLLMAYSNKFGYMVLTNGNKSEVSVGYSTLYGDMCGGFSVVKDLYKSDLYKLAEWRNNNIPSISLLEKTSLIPKNILTKEPTAELKPNQMDKDTLPPYEVLDKILYLLVEKESSISEIVDAGFEVDVVTKVQNMLYNSEYKRRQAAPGVKISERNFGYDRRYPITNAFRDSKGS